MDSTGHIRHRHVGPLTAEDVKNEILPLIQRLGSGRTARLGQSRLGFAIFAGDFGEKTREIWPAIGDRLDRRAADCDWLSAHLVGAEPLIEEPRRIFAQHPKDRRPPPCSDEPAEQRDQQPAPNPLVLPIRGDVKREHFAGERAFAAVRAAAAETEDCAVANRPRRARPAAPAGSRRATRLRGAVPTIRRDRPWRAPRHKSCARSRHLVGLCRARPPAAPAGS